MEKHVCIPANNECHLREKIKLMTKTDWIISLRANILHYPQNLNREIRVVSAEKNFRLRYEGALSLNQESRMDDIFIASKAKVLIALYIQKIPLKLRLYLQ